MGHSWGTLGALLGHPWGTLGALLGHLGPILGRLGALLGHLGPFLGHFQWPFGALLGNLGPIGRGLDGSWSDLGRVLYGYCPKLIGLIP